MAYFRNLKPSKMLLKYKNDDSSVKLIDLGINMQQQKSNNKKQNQEQQETTEFSFLAPEQLDGKDLEVSNSWSVGVFLYILFSGQHPFQSNDPQKSLDQIKKGIFTFTKGCFHNSSIELKDLLSKLLTKNEKRRFTVKQCLDHEWTIQSENSLRFDQPLAENTFANLKKFYAQFIDEVDYEEEERLAALRRQREEEERRKREQELRQIQDDDERKRLQEEYEIKKREDNRIKRRMIMCLVGQIPQQHLERLKQVFKAIDANGNGQLNLEELLTGMAKFQSGPNAFSEQELTQIFKKMDEDNSGEVSQEEFITSFAEQFATKNKQFIMNSFKALDKDGSGRLSIQEIVKLLQSGSLPLGDVSVDEIINLIDKDKDGEIDYLEFFDGLNISE